MSIGLTLQTAIKEWQTLNAKIETYEAMIEELKAKRDELENSFLVKQMQLNGLNSIKTDDGYEVKIEKYVNAKIQEGLEAQAYEFIEKQGYGSIIKRQFDLEKGVETGGIKAFLDKEGISYQEKLNVHYQSLRKAVKEILEAGEQMFSDFSPADIFPVAIAVDTFPKAVIKKIKEK